MEIGNVELEQVVRNADKKFCEYIEFQACVD